MFGWFKKSAQVVESKKVMLHGHDLSKWHYLGYTCCKWTGDNKKIVDKNLVFLFCDKRNEKIRSYHIDNDTRGYCEKYHTFISSHIKPWAAGEGELWHMISSDEYNKVSDYLKGYMFERFHHEWDNESKWWKRSTKPVPTNTLDEPEVVKVEFGK